MIVSLAGFTMRLIFSPLHGVRLAGQVLGYALGRNMSSVKHKINVNTKHLTQGDALPPFNGKLRLYNMRFCPYAHRVVLALNAKNIDYEVVNIDLVDKPDWFFTKSTYGKLPAFEIDDGVSIIESLVIVQYLEDVFPERPLLPKDPLMKAFDNMIVKAVGQIHSVVFKLVKAPDTLTDEVITSLFSSLDLIQGHLQKRGTKFLDGDQPGYADYMIWPWFERLPSFSEERIKMDPQKYKLLLDYMKNMMEDPIVKNYALTNELYQEYHAAFPLGKKPNFNRLTEEW